MKTLSDDQPLVSYLMTYFTLRDNPAHESKPNRLLPTDSFQRLGHLPSERVLDESAVPNKNSETLGDGAPWKDIQTALTNLGLRLESNTIESHSSSQPS